PSSTRAATARSTSRSPRATSSRSGTSSSARTTRRPTSRRWPEARTSSGGPSGVHPWTFSLAAAALEAAGERAGGDRRHPPAVRGERHARGVRAAGAVDPAAGVRGGRGEVEAADRRLRPGELGGRAEDELLVELRRPAVDRAADEVAVRRLERRRRVDVAAADAVAEAGREPLHLLLH